MQSLFFIYIQMNREHSNGASNECNQWKGTKKKSFANVVIYIYKGTLYIYLHTYNQQQHNKKKKNMVGLYNAQ